MVRQRRQCVTHGQNILDQQPGYKADHRPQRQVEKAEKHRRQPADEHDAHRPQAQQVAQKGHRGETAEIVGADRRRQCQTPEGCRNTNSCKGKKPAMLFLSCQPPVELGRQPQQPHHRPEGQLQADGLRREGVVQQNQEQRRHQSRGRVALPAEQGRRRQKAQHHAGPHHRGRPASEHRVEDQRRDGCRRCQTPAVLSRKKAHHRQQIRAVHSADRQNVIDPRLGQIHVRLGGQFPFPARQQRQQKTGVVPRK